MFPSDGERTFLYFAGFLLRFFKCFSFLIFIVFPACCQQVNFLVSFEFCKFSQFHESFSWFSKKNLFIYYFSLIFLVFPYFVLIFYQFSTNHHSFSIILVSLYCIFIFTQFSSISNQIFFNFSQFSSDPYFKDTPHTKLIQNSCSFPNDCSLEYIINIICNFSLENPIKEIFFNFEKKRKIQEK